MLEEENKSLRIEINDLKTTLRLNKGIIEDFFKQSTDMEKNNVYVKKLKEEIEALNIRNDKIMKEKEDLISRLNFIEQTSNESLSLKTDEFEQLKTKNFLLENLVLKKESALQILKKKIDKYENYDFNNPICEKEIYVQHILCKVVDPSLAVNQVYDELILYKQVYENLAEYIKDARKSNNKLEKGIHVGYYLLRKYKMRT